MTNKVPICPYCGEPMLFSFCLPKCEWVCVPCGEGFGLLDVGERIEFPEEQIEALKEKYKKDMHKKSYETAKTTNGSCKFCGEAFNCKVCQEAEKHEYEYWGKGVKHDNTSKG